MLGSLFIVDAFSEMAWGVGEVVPDTDEPKGQQNVTRKQLN